MPWFSDRELMPTGKVWCEFDGLAAALSIRLRVLVVAIVRLLMAVAMVMGLGSASTAASTLNVVTTSEAVNGDTSSPVALQTSPGPDGISLPEAMLAANQVPGPHRIGFDIVLSGSTITLTGGLPTISVRGLTIDGDIDADGDPDVTINGSGSSSGTGINIRASETTIIGLDIQGFTKHGIHISTDAGSGLTEVKNIEIRYSRITSVQDAIAIHIWQQEDCVIADIVIRDNELLNSGSGVSIISASGVGNRNSINNVSIQDNTISNPTSSIAISALGGLDSGNHNNVIQGLDIVGNTISGHTGASLVIKAGNAAACQFNEIRQVLIADNTITGTPVTIDLVGGDGPGAVDNITSNVSILRNQLTGGGVVMSAGYDSTTSNNRIEDITIGWNRISNCAANGVMAVGGSAGASWNTIQRVTITNNQIVGCTDAGILLHGDYGTSPDNHIDEIDIINNTIVDNGNAAWAGGININTKHSNNWIQNVDISSTILWGNGGSDAIRGSIAPTSVSDSLLGDSRYTVSPDNFYSDPLFDAAATPDFPLLGTSPAIDKGENPKAASAGDHDLDLALRLWDGDGDTVAVVDIGAYEYGATPFAITSHMLTVTLSGSGTGTVTSLPAGINCPGDCAEVLELDTLVSLTAVAADGSVFAGWSGAGCSGLGTCHVTMDAAQSVNAEFAIETFTVGGNVSGLAGSGLVIQNNERDDLEIDTIGSFTFVTAIDDDSDYAVTVLTQPVNPGQVCVVSNGSGTLDGAAVTNVSIHCETTCNVNMVSDVTASSGDSFEACEILSLGPSFSIEEDASVSLFSGWTIIFQSGCSIGSGVTLSTNMCGQSLCIASAALPMPYGCHPCVSLICDDDPDCCVVGFDQTCVNQVATVCDLVCE